MKLNLIIFFVIIGTIHQNQIFGQDRRRPKSHYEIENKRFRNGMRNHFIVYIDLVKFSDDNNEKEDAICILNDAISKGTRTKPVSWEGADGLVHMKAIFHSKKKAKDLYKPLLKWDCIVEHARMEIVKPKRPWQQEWRILLDN